MTNFQTLIVPSQLLIPAVCSGVLLLGWLLFTYMYLRSRQALHFTMLLLFFFGFIFAFAEAMILTTGQWQLDPSLGTNAHRIEQLAGAFFMVGIPLLVHSLTELTPTWKTVNRYLIYAGIALAFCFVVVAFVAPDLFISQATRKPTWGTIQADYGRGLEGPLYQVRDGLIGLMIVYALVCFIFEMIRYRKIAYILVPFIGFLFAIYGAFVDIVYVYTMVYYDPTPWSPHSRFTVGITIMIVFCMAGVFRKFFDMAHEVERAEEHASREAAKSLEQNSFIRGVLNTGSGSLVDSMESLSATIGDFNRHSQEQAAATEEVTASIEQITAGVDNVKNSSDDQYATLEALLGTMETLSGLIVSMNSQVEEALVMIDQISNNALAGEKSLAVMGESMGKISSSSQEMTGVIQIINDISDKINLLSLNAAIEAARAGDAGRGFAVVADEISKLADQTTSSIKSIDDLIRTNEQEIINGNRNVSQAIGKINSIISDIEKIVEKITVISNQMNQQTLANQTVNENAEKVKVRSEQITNAMKEQKLAIEEISRTVGSINDLSQQNTHQIIQISDSTKSIVSMVEKMHLDIEKFAGKGEGGPDDVPSV